MNRFFLALLIIALLPVSAIAEGGSPLILTYAGGTGAGESTSKYVENAWTYTYQYHVFVLTGDLPQGNLFSQLQIEERDGKTGLASAKLALSGSTYAMEIGDNTANFSDITLNGVAYQGTSITLKPNSNFNVTILGGAKGHGLWGYDVRRDNRERENFTGLRTNFNIGSDLGLNTTFLTSPGGTQVIAYGGEYSLNDVKLAAEYGSSSPSLESESAEDSKAYRLEMKYQSNYLTLGTIYRNVGTDYIVPMDYQTFRGMKGTYSTLNFRPSNTLSINLQNDSFLDRLNADPELTINNTRGDINYNMSSGTSIGFSGWRTDNTARERGGMTDGEMMYITQQFFLLTKNAVYYRLQPSWFNAGSASDESYSEKKEVTGINIALLDYLHLNYEIENTTRILKTTDIEINPSAVAARVDLFETPIFGMPLYLSSSYNYRKDIADRNSTEESTSTYEDVTLKYKPNSDFSCYISGKIYNMDAPTADRSTREQKDISFGLNYSFNTYIFLK